MERHICSLAAAAAARGHTVRLLTTSNSLGPEQRSELMHPRIEFRELARARGTAGPIAKWLWLWNETRLSRNRSWDVIYTNGQSGLAPLVWRAAGPHTRIVHHHHTAADAGEQATWSRSFRRVLQRAPRLVGCSRATCASLNAALERNDVSFLPYFTQPPIAENEIVERVPHSPVRFGFCGRLIVEKGIETILALARQPELSDIEWHIHGEGPAYPAARFAGQPRLVYHGPYRTAEEHARALLALDALVLFSTHNEGMPLSLIEGLAAGLPWIGTDRGGTRELAVPGSDSVLAPAAASLAELGGSVRTLADRILAGTTSRRRQRLIYDQEFAPPVVSQRWFDFFTS
jgi:glycosyltransferase involved in cell wall biosynthesis